MKLLINFIIYIGFFSELVLADPIDYSFRTERSYKEGSDTVTVINKFVTDEDIVNVWDDKFVIGILVSTASGILCASYANRVLDGCKWLYCGVVKGVKKTALFLKNTVKNIWKILSSRRTVYEITYDNL